MYNRTAVGVAYNSSAPCPYPGGPCSCKNGSDGTSVHTCKAWDTQRFPYGSEFAFDTTGQEEVYIWARQASVPSCTKLPDMGLPSMHVWPICLGQSMQITHPKTSRAAYGAVWQS